MDNLKTYLLFILGFTGMAQLQGQALEISITDSLPSPVSDEIRAYEGYFADSLSLEQQINEVQNFLYSEGYLLSEASLHITDSLAQLRITPGPEIYQSHLELKLPEGFTLPQRKVRRPDKETASPRALQETAEYHLQFLENHGYPFARLEVSDYSLQNDTLTGNLEIIPGPLVKIDSIAIKGFDRFPRNVIRFDLELETGMLYDESLLQNLPERAQRIEFLRMTRAPAVAFTKTETVIYLYFEEVQSNEVNGVVGLNTSEEGEVTLNGDFQLRLLNILKKGEELELQWRRPDENVQSLDLRTEIPYLVNTPFWLEADLSIFRQDSSFVNTSVEGLLKYLLESGSFISGGIDYRSSNVLQGAEGQNRAGLNSFNTTFYKLGLELNQTNRAVIPTSGYRWVSYGLTGSRKSEDASQEQYGLEIRGEYYWNLKNHVVKLGAQSEALFGEDLYLNELFRIGGLQSLRGFNEQSIYSSSYAIGTLEYRYMIGEYDYLTAFTDVAWSETNTINEFSSNIFTGIGAGINFRTGAGIFALFYALGRDNENPFDARTSKIHFGYVNQF